MTTLDSRHRPYKVWSGDRQTRKGVVAGSLQELRELGGEKLGYGLSGEVRVVLESDGTEIEDDTYFQLVDKDTIFLLLRPGERWLPPGVEAIRAVTDEPDASGRAETELNLNLGQILKSLRRDVASLMLLSTKQLQAVAEMDSDQLQKLSHSDVDRRFLKSVQEVCDRMLLEQQGAQEAIQLVKLLNKDSSCEHDVTDTGTCGQQSNQSCDEADLQSGSENPGFEALSRVRQWQKHGSTTFTPSSSGKTHYRRQKPEHSLFNETEVEGTEVKRQKKT